MFTTAEIKAKMTLAIDAAEAGNYSLAITYGESALAMLSVVPDMKKEGFAGGEFDYRPENFELLLKSWRQSGRAASSKTSRGGLNIFKLQHKPADLSATTDCD